MKSWLSRLLSGPLHQFSSEALAKLERDDGWMFIGDHTVWKTVIPTERAG